MITDCHIHISPLDMFKPSALELMRAKRPNFAQIEEYCRSPKAFLKFLDAAGVERAALINYVAPEVIGLAAGVNQFVSDYVKEDPKRLLSCGSLHPRHSTNILSDVEQLLRQGIRMIKIHPPHQVFFPNDYLRGVSELEIIYRAAEANGIPVMFHTGTSIFPGARNKYGDPIYLDDVAVDFPRMRILLAHGGRPLWMETAFFLVRRHPNVYLDISGIRRRVCQYFPRSTRSPCDAFGDWPAWSAGHSEEPGGFSRLRTFRSSARPDSEQDRAGDLARLTVKLERKRTGEPSAHTVSNFPNYFAALLPVSSSTKAVAP
jgi:predicted TIM-barrel fold metal-dependent hydrolase